MYTITIAMQARAEPLVFDAADLADTDTAATLGQLIEAMDRMDPDEAADQVHESYAFDLCTPCRERLHKGLKAAAG